MIAVRQQGHSSPQYASAEAPAPQGFDRPNCAPIAPRGGSSAPASPGCCVHSASHATAMRWLEPLPRTNRAGRCPAASGWSCWRAKFHAQGSPHHLAAQSRWMARLTCKGKEGGSVGAVRMRVARTHAIPAPSMKQDALLRHGALANTLPPWFEHLPSHTSRLTCSVIDCQRPPWLPAGGASADSAPAGCSKEGGWRPWYVQARQLFRASSSTPLLLTLQLLAALLARPCVLTCDSATLLAAPSSLLALPGDP